MSDADKMDEANVRIEQLFWLPGVITEPPQEFIDAIEEMDDAAPIHSVLPEIQQERGWSEDEGFSHRDYVGELCCRLARQERSGFIFKAATPVTSRHKAGSYQFSWAHYRTAWFYVEHIDQIADWCAAWAESMRKLDRAKAA